MAKRNHQMRFANAGRPDEKHVGCLLKKRSVPSSSTSCRSSLGWASKSKSSSCPGRRPAGEASPSRQTPLLADRHLDAQQTIEKGQVTQLLLGGGSSSLASASDAATRPGSQMADPSTYSQARPDGILDERFTSDP